MDFKMFEKDPSLNVFGTRLESCSEDPVTGFFRDGCCNTHDTDYGSHTVCIKVTADFLNFSSDQGNDLSTPRPLYDFPGLQPGDRWCLCAARWLEAYQFGVPPKVFLHSTHQKALEIIPLELLQEHAVDLN